MDDGVSVTVVKSRGDLASKFPSMLLFEFAMGNDIVEHLSSVDVLQDHVIMMRQDHNFVQADNVWMMKDHHDRCLTNGPCLAIVFLLLLGWGHIGVGLHARDNLDCDLVAGAAVHSEFHFAHTARTKGLGHVVVAKDSARLNP